MHHPSKVINFFEGFPQKWYFFLKASLMAVLYMSMCICRLKYFLESKNISDPKNGNVGAISECSYLIIDKTNCKYDYIFETARFFRVFWDYFASFHRK